METMITVTKVAMLQLLRYELLANVLQKTYTVSQRPSKIIRTALQSAVVTSDPWYTRRLLRQELGYFEVVGVVFRTVVVAFG